MTYIPDLTERYPEPDDSMSGNIEVGQVWEHNSGHLWTKIVEVHDHYIITIFGNKIELDDLKNQWVLIG